MLIFILILVSVALVISLAFNMFGQPRGPKVAPRAESHRHVDASSSQPSVAASVAPSLEAELERKRKELEEARQANTELKGELKQAKRKLYETREASKDGNDLAKARAEVERSASQQLDAVRSELGAALAEVAKLKQEAESRGRRPQPHTPALAPVVPAAAPVEAVAAPVAAPPAAPREEPKRVIRELNEAEKERLDRAEHVANKERARAAELDREVKRLKGRVEAHNRVHLVSKGELELVKDKFKALEKRLNRTLLEKDLIHRALKDLAAKSGDTAGRTELTTEEIAASDQTVDDRMAAEAEQLKASAAKLEAGAAAEASVESPAASPETNGAVSS